MVKFCVLTLCQKAKFFDFSKFKPLLDNKFNVAKMMISGFDRVENIVRKGENASY